MLRKKRKHPSRNLSSFSYSRSHSSSKNSPIQLEVSEKVGREISIIVWGFLLVFTFLSMSNKTGRLGEMWNTFLSYSIGLWGIYLLLILGVVILVCLLIFSHFSLDTTRKFGIGLLFFSLLALFGISAGDMNAFSDDPKEAITGLGGYVGFLSNILLIPSIGQTTSRILLAGISLIALLLIFQHSFMDMIAYLFFKKERKIENTKPVLTEKEEEEILMKMSQQKKIEKPAFVIKTAVDKSIKKDIQEFTLNEISGKQKQKWEIPPLDLLNAGSSEVVIDRKFLEANAEKIREKLMQFTIPVTMKELNVGPTVMQYTLEPEAGIKLSKITTLKNDLALALAAKSIRIEAPIPGKSLVGIEIPNEKRMIVYLREILESKEFFDVKSTLRFPLGKDVAGNPVVDALNFMPHMLIAGATGSGKSVAINSLLISLLYQNSPQDLKLILVDPKRVELDSYNLLPHLLTPVITEPEKAINALRWTVAEMTRRYKECQTVGARNRDEYNAKVETQQKMPFLVFVIDELADLMMTSMKKEVETLICRIAQMARAVGIHLVLATQRPSVDVITGLIKANIPVRIAFSVVSSVDSRTILDAIGAEDLIGKGDMLYVSSNMSKPMRIQGVFISSEEIQRVTTRVRMTMQPEYDEGVVVDKKMPTDFLPKGSNETSVFGENLTDDQLVEQAIGFIRETGKASASIFQRRFKLGYARAARIIDMLEEQGIVGPAYGSKPREILIEVQGKQSAEEPQE